MGGEGQGGFRRRRRRPRSFLFYAILWIIVPIILLSIISWAWQQKERHEQDMTIGVERIAERLIEPVAALNSADKEDIGLMVRSFSRRGRKVWLTPSPIIDEFVPPFPSIEAVWMEIEKQLASGGIEKKYLGWFEDDDLKVLDDWHDEMEERGNRRGPGSGKGGGWRMHERHMGEYEKRWRGHRDAPDEFLLLSAELSSGQWVNVAIPFNPFGFGWKPSFPFGFVFTVLLIIAVTVWAMRRAARPLTTFTKAAERLGRDVNAPPLEVKGPREVRRAAAAFNQMQERLRIFIKDRTQMLAAVSHDLRTPITRLRLRAEFMEDEVQREKMLADLEEMETMIAATLSFARDDAAAEPTKRLDIAALLQSLCSDMEDAGKPVNYHGPEAMPVAGRPTSLKRAFVNLLENAAKYGGGTVDLRLTTEDEYVVVVVEDSGAGIPVELLEKVFDPFYRVESSRNRETGGTGLGLSVVRSIIHAHGGTVTLSNRAEGGLKVVVTLPSEA